MVEGIMIYGEFRKIKYNRDILRQTVGWLMDKGLLNQGDVPIIKKDTKYVINNKPVHSNGTEFNTKQKLDQALFLEVNWSPKEIVEISRQLLEKYNVNKNALKIVEVKEETTSYMNL